MSKSINFIRTFSMQSKYHHWFRLWLVAWLASSHYLNHCWNIVNWTLRNKLQWNFYQNSYIFIEENAFKNVCKMASISSLPECVNTLRPRQDRRNFADNIFTCIFFNENCCILIKFSLKYVRKGPIDNNPALVQIMAWCRSGDKPLSEPMMVSLPTHICVTRPQWVKSSLFRLWLVTEQVQDIT